MLWIDLSLLHLPSVQVARAQRRDPYLGLCGVDEPLDRIRGMRMVHNGTYELGQGVQPVVAHLWWRKLGWVRMQQVQCECAPMHEKGEEHLRVFLVMSESAMGAQPSPLLLVVHAHPPCLPLHNSGRLLLWEDVQIRAEDVQRDERAGQIFHETEAMQDEVK